MNEKKELFENAPIGKALAAMAIPTIISQLISMIYNMADTIFIGMTDDPYKVAAASVVGNVFFVLSAFTNLFGVGGGSLMSRLLGVSREEEASGKRNGRLDTVEGHCHTKALSHKALPGKKHDQRPERQI